MTKLTLTFQKAGLLTSLQDQGRLGYQDKGVPFGGIMDRSAAKNANLLVGNNIDQIVLEMTMLGPTIHFSHAAQIAVTGGQFPLMLNGQSINSYEKINVAADSILQFGHVEKGCRAYMAIAADWPFEKWLGSVSPLIIGGKTGSGILTENILKDGQALKLNLGSKTRQIATSLAIHPANLSPSKRLRVILGPEFHYLRKEAVAQFFGQSHKISQEASRMGYKLTSEIQLNKYTPEMISSGILPGTIQLTSGGQPIVLLADAQTTGGYPRIARIIDEDLDAMAQMKPGGEVWFSLV